MKPDNCETPGGRIRAEFAEDQLVGRGQQYDGIGGGVPAGKDIWVGEGEVETGV